MPEDLYETLEVSPQASTETIEAAYRSLVRRSHPDGRPVAERGAAEERTKSLNAARAVLTDPASRRKYDRSREYYAPRPEPRPAPAPAYGPPPSQPPVRKPAPPQETPTPRPSTSYGMPESYRPPVRRNPLPGCGAILFWCCVAYFAVLAFAVVGWLVTAFAGL